MREDKVHVHREQVASAADKATRSRSIQARTAMGKVYFPSKATWLAEFTAELLTFPAGKHDDMVDTLGLIGRMLDDMIPAARAKPDNGPPKRDAYRSVRQSEESWRA
jgi:hypothetical protein